MAAIEALALQVFENDDPLSRSSVISLVERFFAFPRGLRTWRMTKRPRKNWAVWTCLRVSDAVRSETRPLAVSSVEPTGMVWAPVSRTKPLGGLAAWDGARGAGRQLDEHLAGDDLRVDGLERHGAARAVAGVAGVLDPVLVLVARAAGVRGRGRRRLGGHRDGPGTRGGVADRVGGGGGGGEGPCGAIGMGHARARSLPHRRRTSTRSRPADQSSSAAAEKGAAPRLPEGSENALKRGAAAVEAGRGDAARRPCQAVTALPSPSTARSPRQDAVVAAAAPEQLDRVPDAGAVAMGPVRDAPSLVDVRAPGDHRDAGGVTRRERRRRRSRAGARRRSRPRPRSPPGRAQRGRRSGRRRRRSAARPRAGTPPGPSTRSKQLPKLQTGQSAGRSTTVCGAPHAPPAPDAAVGAADAAGRVGTAVAERAPRPTPASSSARARAWRSTSKPVIGRARGEPDGLDRLGPRGRRAAGRRRRCRRRRLAAEVVGRRATALPSGPSRAACPGPVGTSSSGPQVSLPARLGVRGRGVPSSGRHHGARCRRRSPRGRRCPGSSRCR